MYGFKVALVLFALIPGQEPVEKTIDMPDISTCVETLVHLLDTATPDGETYYAVACELTPTEERKA